MKYVLQLALVMALTSSFAQASNPARDGVEVFYGMSAVKTTFDFQKLDSTVTITVDHSSSTMTLNYVLEGQPTQVELELTLVDKDECNRTYYDARLKTQNSNGMTERYSVRLVNRDNTTCSEYGLRYHAYAWTAEVRKGYGWCGTMDATMSLVGNPRY